MTKTYFEIDGKVAIMFGKIKDITSGISRAGNTFTKLTLTRQKYDSDLCVDVDIDNDIVFTDTDSFSWAERIDTMKLAPGATVVIRANINKTDNGVNYYGSLVTYLTRAGVDFPVSIKGDGDSKDKEYRVILGRVNRQYCEYEESKNMGVVPISVRKYNKNEPNDEKKNYFCNFKCKLFNDKDDETKKFGQELYKHFIGKKDDAAMFGLFILDEASKFISDKQKDADHPTVVHYNLLSWDEINIPERPEKADKNEKSA